MTVSVLVRRVRAMQTTRLVVSRAVEQLTLALIGVLVAKRVGVAGFAPVSALLAINSMAVALSDYGVGLGILRVPPAVTAADRSLGQVRSANSAVAVVGIVVGLVLGGDGGVVIAGGSVLWGLSAEAYIRKSASLRRGAAASIARAEILSSVVAFAAVLLWPGDQLLAVLVALAAKHLLELFLVTEWRATFSADGRSPQPAAIWVSQLATFIGANVDYVLVAWLLGSEAFALYSMAFRLASAVPAVASTVMIRQAIVDVAAATDGSPLDELQRVYDRYVRRLFHLGLAGAGAVVVGAGLLVVLLGPSWRPIGGIALVLALCVPWRLLLGMSAAVALNTGQSRPLARWEVARAVLTSVVCVLGAAWGMWSLLVAVVVVSVVGVIAQHRAACTGAGIVTWRKGQGWAGATVLTAAALAVAFASG